MLKENRELEVIPVMLKQEYIAGLIDHTQLKADTSRGDIERLCGQAVSEGFFSVCVNPFWVKEAADMLKGQRTKVCTVIGFPLGADTPRTKARQAEIALEDGARELDMVINIGAVKSGDYKTVAEEINSVKKTGAEVLKVIIETCYLTDDEKVRLCRLVKECGADFVKTSTGFGTSGATASDVRLIRAAVGTGIGVKASGGIRDLDTLIGMVEAGASRIGTSSGMKIMEEVRTKLEEE